MSGKTVNEVMANLLAQDNFTKRLEQTLGNSSKSFISSLIQLLSADKNLSEAFVQNPMSVFQVAMKAANLDLPIGNEFGFAYILPIRVNGLPSAQFILGYKGLIQLALRSNRYTALGATEVREGELKKNDPLFGNYEIEWIQDPSKRALAPIVGYVAGFETRDGFKKQIYMTKEEILAHEQKTRRGNYQSPAWKTNFDSMAKKTVFRRLLNTYGYLIADPEYTAETSSNYLSNTAEVPEIETRSMSESMGLIDTISSSNEEGD